MAVVGEGFVNKTVSCDIGARQDSIRSGSASRQRHSPPTGAYRPSRGKGICWEVFGGE